MNPPVKKGLKIHTYTWDQLNRRICADFVSQLKASGFKGKWLIIESTEQSIKTRTEASLTCLKNDTNLPTRTIKFPLPNIKSKNNLDNYKAQIDAGTLTDWHALRYFFEGDKLTLINKGSPNTIIRKVPNGCILFSHKACPETLFLERGDKSEVLQSDTLLLLENLSTRTPEFNVLWLVIPQKITVYLHNDNEVFWKNLENSNKLNGLNLLEKFDTLKFQIKDFYLPNDTHLSTSGYYALGEIVANELARNK